LLHIDTSVHRAVQGPTFVKISREELCSVKFSRKTYLDMPAVEFREVRSAEAKHSAF
jgi:hypothetical protein